MGLKQLHAHNVAKWTFTALADICRRLTAAWATPTTATPSPTPATPTPVTLTPTPATPTNLTAAGSTPAAGPARFRAAGVGVEKEACRGDTYGPGAAATPAAAAAAAGAGALPGATGAAGAADEARGQVCCAAFAALTAGRAQTILHVANAHSAHTYTRAHARAHTYARLASTPPGNRRA
jgi:hypothetical protein